MKKIDFIENKILNFDTLKKIYQISYKKNDMQILDQFLKNLKISYKTNENSQK